MGTSVEPSGEVLQQRHHDRRGESKMPSPHKKNHVLQLPTRHLRLKSILAATASSLQPGYSMVVAACTSGASSIFSGAPTHSVVRPSLLLGHASHGSCKHTHRGSLRHACHGSWMRASCDDVDEPEATPASEPAETLCDSLRWPKTAQHNGILALIL